MHIHYAEYRNFSTILQAGRVSATLDVDAAKPRFGAVTVAAHYLQAYNIGVSNPMSDSHFVGEE